MFGADPDRIGLLGKPPSSRCMVQLDSIGCSVAQLVVRWLAVRQARDGISARHPMEISPNELTTAVKTWRWDSANVYE